MNEKSGRWHERDLDFLDCIYQLQCLSRMNAIYYELRLSQVQAISFWMELAIAATASGSGLVSLFVQHKGYMNLAGSFIWPVIALSAAVAAIIRPIYAPGRSIESFVRQHHGYQNNYFSLKKLAFSLRQTGFVTDDHRKQYDACFDRHVQLSTDSKAVQDEATPKDRYREKAQKRTATELPADRFWWPKIPDQPSGAETAESKKLTAKAD